MPKFKNPFPGTMRSQMRDYTKQRLGNVPLLQAAPPGVGVKPMKTRDYSKLSPISLTDLEGPLVLEKTPKPFKPKF